MADLGSDTGKKNIEPIVFRGLPASSLHLLYHPRRTSHRSPVRELVSTFTIKWAHE
jgi:hypothetical protein